MKKIIKRERDSFILSKFVVQTWTVFKDSFLCVYTMKISNIHRAT